MIIGLSGKAGSGKDTVCKIFQYFTIPKQYRTVTIEEWVKTIDYTPDVCSFLTAVDSNIDSESNNIMCYIENKKFAYKLKQLGALLLNVPVEKFEDQDFKLNQLPGIWNRWALLHSGGLSYHENKESAIGVIKYLNLFPGEYELKHEILTVRDFLQQLATDCIRDGFHPNTWINALFSEYTPTDTLLLDGSTGRWPLWIISDVRFNNELDAIAFIASHQLPGDEHGDDRILIKITRDKQQSTDHIVPDQDMEDSSDHISELELDDYMDWDYIIENNGNFDELAFQVHTVLTSNREVFSKYFHI